MINGQNLPDQPVKNCVRKCDNIQRTTNNNGNDYTTS